MLKPTQLEVRSSISLRGKLHLRRGRRLEHGNVSGHDAPTFRKAYPDLALAPHNSPPVHGTLEFQSDASEIAAKGDNVQSTDGASEIGRRAAFAERFDLGNAVKIFGNPEAHGL